MIARGMTGVAVGHMEIIDSSAGSPVRITVNAKVNPQVTMADEALKTMLTPSKGISERMAWQVAASMPSF